MSVMTVISVTFLRLSFILGCNGMKVPEQV